jgi:NADPH:quinone reductase-like Zn-dependent oxidoreductase
MAERWVAERPGGPEVFQLVSYDVPPPVRGEVTIEVRAAGVNPADASHVEQGKRGPFPRGVGYEVAGVLTAVGPSTTIASGGGAVGDEVLAFRVLGGWATDLTVPARDVFAKPAVLSFGQAANLLLAATNRRCCTWPGSGRETPSWRTALRAPSGSACCSRRR